ncbi:MAG TPA: 3-isopropylmalate dehydratase small subunit [Ramlibacter sp.]|nr:3-isopropylmalate dehydratase small subunit [Ramlibacter sp.]
METFTSVTGVAAPMLQINIDTDQIIPARYLGGTDAKGYGAHLFANARFLPDGGPHPGFVLNRAPFDQARVLLADRNFGCGSSRERAPKALREFGIRSVIAPSFGGIFFNNCFRNGLLPVALPIEQVREIARLTEPDPVRHAVTVDLHAQAVTVEGTSWRASFRTPETLRQMLLQGVDEIDQTLSHKPRIDAWRAADRARRPWAYTAPAPLPR